MQLEKEHPVYGIGLLFNVIKCYREYIGLLMLVPFCRHLGVVPVSSTLSVEDDFYISGSHFVRKSELETSTDNQFWERKRNCRIS